MSLIQQLTDMLWGDSLKFPQEKLYSQSTNLKELTILILVEAFCILQNSVAYINKETNKRSIK